MTFFPNNYYLFKYFKYLKKTVPIILEKLGYDYNDEEENEV